ncbi:IucA/IucC family siderophore biosynthesis protein [Streptomyces sp. ME03-5709C]|nr:IucA/IucC family siderophore biosynthesis protein [Streptomyces sp. ME03-5709C]
MYPHSAAATRRPLETAFTEDLGALRPDLRDAYAAALPGARAAVLGRLWRALLLEPLPGIASRGPGRVLFRDGRLLTGPRRLPHDLGTPQDEPVLLLDGRPHDHPAALVEALGLPGSGLLREELDHSVASLALSRAGAAGSAGAHGGEDAQGGQARGARPPTLACFEQGVVDGHPYHPCCRSRPGFSVAEQLAYGPEHRPVVALDLVAVPAARCLVTGAWPDRFRDGDRLLLPAHPWQTRHILPALGLRPYAEAAVPARPLMSVRTLAPLDGGPHLKTALSMRMTSSVRDISARSVTDSAPLSALLDELTRRLAGDTLHITRNLAAAAAVVGGEAGPDLAALLRQCPSRFADRAGGESVLPVAALTGRPAAGGPPLLRTLLGAAGPNGPPDGAVWLTAFAGLALPALLRLLSWGVALEAHGQNLLVVLDRHARPLRLVYRDLADVRISPARLARHGVRVPPLGRSLSDDPAVLHAKLYGSLVATTFGSLVSALGEGHRRTEARLWATVRTQAVRAFDALPTTADTLEDRAALLHAPELPVKALTSMRLETSARGDRWTGLPNPLL